MIRDNNLCVFFFALWVALLLLLRSMRITIWRSFCDTESGRERTVICTINDNDDYFVGFNLVDSINRTDNADKQCVEIQTIVETVGHYRCHWLCCCRCRWAVIKVRGRCNVMMCDAGPGKSLGGVCCLCVYVCNYVGCWHTIWIMCTILIVAFYAQAFRCLSTFFFARKWKSIDLATITILRCYVMAQCHFVWRAVWLRTSISLSLLNFCNKQVHELLVPYLCFFWSAFDWCSWINWWYSLVTVKLTMVKISILLFFLSLANAHLVTYASFHKIYAM